MGTNKELLVPDCVIFRLRALFSIPVDRFILQKNNFVYTQIFVPGKTRIIPPPTIYSPEHLTLLEITLNLLSYTSLDLT